MKLPEMAVKRPVTILMIFLAFFVLGIASYTFLPIDMMPKIEPPSISVVTTYLGVGAEDVEETVSQVIENELSTISGIEEITSISKENLSVVTFKFDWDTDIDVISNDIRDKIEFAKWRLPKDILPPMIFHFGSEMFPILFYGVNATESFPKLKQIIENEIVDHIKTLPGVGAIIMIGGLNRQIRVDINRHALEAHNLSFNDITRAIRMENVNIPAGSIKIGQKDLLIRVPGEFKRVSELEQIVVGIGNTGAPIHMKEVATVRDAFEDQSQRAFFKGKPGIMFFVQKRSGANTVSTCEEVKSRVEKLAKKLPDDVSIEAIYDTSYFIKNSINNLRHTIMVGGLIVMVVVFLFLKKWRTSLIILLTIPFSLIVAFIFLYLFDYTINTMSLMSLAIGLGMVVDNAIVVLENITRHQENGESVLKASVEGTSEVGLAITASTLTTVVIFVPLIFVTGLVGVMFKQLAFVVSITLFASLFTALTLTPMLSSKLLKEEGSSGGLGSKGRFYMAIEDTYIYLLRIALKNRALTLMGMVLFFAGTVGLLLLGLIKVDFIPQSDASEVRATMYLPPGTHVDVSEEYASKAYEIIQRTVPEREHVFYQTGQSKEGFSTSAGFPEGDNIVVVGARLVPLDQRERSAAEIGDALRIELQKLPGVARLDIETSDPLTKILTGGGKPVSIEIRGYDFKVTDLVARDIRDRFKTIDELADLSISRDPPRPGIAVKIDRAKAASLGLNTATIGNALRTAFYGKLVTKFREGGDEYDISVQMSDEGKQEINDIENILIKSFTGAMVPLKNVASIEEEYTPVEILRQDQERVIRVEANIKGGVPLGVIGNKVGEILKDVTLPPGIEMSIGGSLESQAETQGDTRWMILLGFLLVYMVMASQFENLLDPFVIMFSIPFAFSGIFIFALISRTTLTMNSSIGAIMLIGIVVNDAIVLVDYINILRRRGMEMYEACITAGRHRLRPIIMTSVTTICAMVPLALSKGEGSQLWKPLGIAVIGGLTMSGLITLIIIPTLYTILGKKERRVIEIE